MKNLLFILILIIAFPFYLTTGNRKVEDFNKNWKFTLDSVNDHSQVKVGITSWRTLNVPHDWSIEFPFDSTSPTGKILF